MAWSTLTAAEVLEELSSAEQGKVNAALDDNTLAAIVARVVDRVRGDIIAGGKVDLDVAGTLPAGLKSDAIAIARWEFLLKTPKNDQLQSEPRRAAWERALDKLALVARGDYTPESASLAATGGGASAVITSRAATVTGVKLKGL